MKGTPFYTGEYNVRQGPAEDRVNLWPLVYYRDPALSVLWPIGEFTEEHAAIRPILSVYGLDRSNRVYNILWPLAQFDRQTGDSRIFPLFWGEDHLTLFPLYWHSDHPFGASGGRDVLFPLWSLYRAREGYETDVLWPFLNFRDLDGVKGWRAWPLAGNYERANGDYYRFGLWPLGHQWNRDSGTRSGTAFAPLFTYNETPEGRRFLSLPYCSSERRDGSAWQLALPLLFHYSDSRSSRLITPLYSRGENQDTKEAWSLFLPLYYSSASSQKRLFATLLGGFRRDEGGLDWLALPLLSGGRKGKDDGDYWFGGPLAHVGWDQTSRSHHVFPLYYRAEDTAGSTFLSLPWSCGRGADGVSWDLVPPVFFRIADRNSAAYCVFPLYYTNDRNGTFVSPLAAKWRRDDDATTYLVPPALSWMTRSPKASDLWIAGPVAHLSWGEDAGSSHILPLYYADGSKHTFISALVARWKSGNTDHWLYPPLLSEYTSDGERQEIHALLGLFSDEWGSGERGGHLIPFYFYRRKAYLDLYTPIFGCSRDPIEGFVYPLTPILGWWTGDYSGGWLFPLFSHERSKTPGFARNTFLWGYYSKDGLLAESSMFPFYGYRSTGSASAASGGSETRFWSLPACWYRNEVSKPVAGGGNEGSVRTRLKKHGFFPLWSYSNEWQPEKNTKDLDASVLLLLYDYKHTVTPTNSAGAVDDYSRSRVLWRLWHSERSNDDVSVDVFPAITYDRKGNDFKKVSFLWRFFRYERSKDGTQLDLLFIPCRR